jgi:hypothetical protein
MMGGSGRGRNWARSKGRALSEIDSAYQVHPNSRIKWKRKVVEGLIMAFSGAKDRREAWQMSFWPMLTQGGALDTAKPHRETQICAKSSPMLAT